MQPDVDKMLKQVREKTGYEVTVSRHANVATYAALTTGSAAHPAHHFPLANPAFTA